jgi:anaerobic magnesium-protoporphyrin IX monomethyl ester cyclase
MADVGAYRIFLGLESVNENILDSYGKKIKNEEQVKAINILRKYGIGIHASFIIGDFDETEQMVLNTINWAKKMKPEIAQFSILTPFPGTALYEQVINENRLLNKNWELFDAIHPTIKLNNLTPKQVQRLFIKSYQKFYFSFSRIFHKSEQINTKTKSKKKFNIIDSVIFPIKFFLKFRFEIFKNSTPIHFHKA